MGIVKMKRLISSIKEAIKVPLRFHWTVAILPLMLIYLNGVAVGIPLFIILFGSLLLHEYGHVWMAHQHNMYVSHTLAHGFGAMAMVHDPDLTNFKRNMKVAGAGPAASFILAALGVIAHLIYPSIWTTYFMYINILLGAFNLLPLFPSDGGRIFYSLLGMKYGGLKAIKIAVWTSWILCGLGAAYGLYIEAWWLIIVMVLLSTMAAQEKRVTEARLEGMIVEYN